MEDFVIRLLKALHRKQSSNYWFIRSGCKSLTVGPVKAPAGAIVVADGAAGDATAIKDGQKNLSIGSFAQ